MPANQLPTSSGSPWGPPVAAYRKRPTDTASTTNSANQVVHRLMMDIQRSSPNMYKKAGRKVLCFAWARVQSSDTGEISDSLLIKSPHDSPALASVPAGPYLSSRVMSLLLQAHSCLDGSTDGEKGPSGNPARYASAITLCKGFWGRCEREKDQETTTALVPCPFGVFCPRAIIKPLSSVGQLC